MIRHLHPTDTPALLPFRQRSGPDEVCSLSRAIKRGRNGFPLFKYTSIALSPRAWQSCWVITRRAAVQAVLRAGPLSGPHAWELSELYLSKSNRQVAVDVLEQLAFPAGTSGARRIFLRMREGNDLFDAARMAGYQPVFNETLFSIDSSVEAMARLADGADRHQLRQLNTTDNHAMFRLFCETVPIDVRTKTGQTLDEWSSSRELPERKRRDWGLEDSESGRLKAVVTYSDIAGRGFLEFATGSDTGAKIGGLVAAGLELGDDKPVYVMVPSYDQKLGEVLSEIGFTQRESYDVMVKSLAVPVTKTAPGMVIAGR